MRLVIAAALLSLLPAAVPSAHAQEFAISIRDHRFVPDQITVPANKRVTLSVSNEDATPEEFESHSMKVEKIIPGKKKAIIRIGPLAPGRYEFVGEFHEKTAKGVVIAQ